MILVKLAIISAVAGGYMWLVSPLLMTHDEAAHWIVFAVWVSVVMPVVYIIWRVDWQR